jgi:hypothetical protein
MACSTEDFKYSSILLNHLEHTIVEHKKFSIVWISYKFNYHCYYWIFKLFQLFSLIKNNTMKYLYNFIPISEYLEVEFLSSMVGSFKTCYDITVQKGYIILRAFLTWLLAGFFLRVIRLSDVNTPVLRPGGEQDKQLGKGRNTSQEFLFPHLKALIFFSGYFFSFWKSCKKKVMNSCVLFTPPSPNVNICRHWCRYAGLEIHIHTILWARSKTAFRYSRCPAAVLILARIPHCMKSPHLHVCV